MTETLPLKPGDQVVYRGKLAWLTEICPDGIHFVTMRGTRDQIGTVAEYLLLAPERVPERVPERCDKARDWP